MSILLKACVVALLFFAPLSFAATEPWAWLIAQIITAFVFTATLLYKKRITAARLFFPVAAIFIFLLILAAAQTLFVKTALDAAPFYPFTMSRVYTLEFIGLILTYGALFVSVTQLFDDSKSRRTLLYIITACGVCIAVAGFAFPSGEYINYLTGRNLTSSSFGPFLNRNHGAVFFNLCFFAAVALFAPGFLKYKALTPGKERTDFILKQLVLFIVILIFAIAAISTRSRGGIISLFSGIFVYALSLCVILPKKNALKAVYVAVLTGIFLLGAFTLYKNFDKFNAFSHRSENISLNIRADIYAGGYYMFKDYKIFGTGFNSYQVALRPYMENDNPKLYISRLHNDWLEFLVGGGLVAGGVIVLCLIWFSVAAFKITSALSLKRKAEFCALITALIVMAGASLFDFHFYIPSNALLFFTIAALAASASFDKEHLKRFKISPAFTMLGAGLLCACVFLTFKQAQGWRYSNFGRFSNPKSRVEYYEKALCVYPEPRIAGRLGIALYNYSFENGLTKEERKALLQKAFLLTQDYLQKYPLYPELMDINDYSKEALYLLK